MKLLTELLSDRPRIDTRVEPHIRILNGALDEDPNSPAGVILQGRIDPATFRFLKLDEHNYQRRQQDRQDIFEALKKGEVPPPVDIGVRGQDFFCDGSDYIIKSPAYIIDGGGRTGTAQRLLELVPDMSVRIMAMCHFNTNAEWEARRFDAVNKNVRKVSSSLHLRNLRTSNDALLTLYGLCVNSKGFPLANRVCWADHMARGDLMRATTIAKVAMVLHSHKTALTTPSADQIAQALRRAAANVTLAAFRYNVEYFFSLVDECWPFSTIEYRRSAPQLKHTFLTELARLLSHHPAFWSESDSKLFVGADDRRKLAKFPIADPTVVQLSGSAGKARHMLYQMLLNHMNSGRRTNRLVAREETEA